MATAHPTIEHLGAYAGGSASDGMNLLVAAHLTYCADCRAVVSGLEGIGGAALSAERCEGIAGPALDAVLDRLDEVAEPADGPVAQDHRVPYPILQTLGSGLDGLKWKFRMPGVHEHELSGFDGERVSLMRVKPGTGIPHHTHEGEEATLILSGEMEDGATIYRRGDVAMADHSDDHRPKIVGDEVCYCLIVLSGKLKFTGTFGPVLNLFSR